MMRSRGTSLPRLVTSDGGCLPRARPTALSVRQTNVPWLVSRLTA